MVAFMLVGLALLGAQDGAGPAPIPAGPTPIVAEYRRLRDAAGREARDHVRLALWCEGHGLDAERARHLALALLIDPADATARGLAGLVLSDGRWAAPDLLARSNRDDPGRVELLADYDARRSAAPSTARGQWALALWAEAHGLPDQARAHWVAVTRLDPGREAAWKRLGYRKHRGGWATEAQVAAEKAEAEAQRLADRHWRPLLEHQKQALRHPGRRDEALRALGDVTDPRAVPSVVHVFGGEGDQHVAVTILGRIDSPLSSLCLAHLAVASDSDGVRGEALDRLARRDLRDFVDPLIRLVRAPFRGTVRPVAGPGSVGELAVEGEDYNIRAWVRPPLLGNPLVSPPPDRDARDAVARAWLAPTPGDPRSALPGNDLLAIQGKLDADRMAQVDRNNVQSAEQALKARVELVKAVNAAIESSNRRVLNVLTRVTGQDFGVDRRAWARWSTDHAGYAAQTTATTEKPTITEEIPVAYQAQLPPPPPRPIRVVALPDFSAGHHSCFAAGTPVRTLDGPRPIESIRPGDLVLVQDGRSGALSFQPVVTTFRNPPAATLRVEFGDDEVVATGIHRFWKAGAGWTMARDLGPGDLLRVLGGVVAVAGVEPDRAQPVFNLEVAEGRSFFAGRSGALVHDNSLVEATPEPFDAPRPTPTKAVAP